MNLVLGKALLSLPFHTDNLYFFTTFSEFLSLLFPYFSVDGHLKACSVYASTLKTVDPDEMQQNIASQQVLHCLILVLSKPQTFLPNFYPVNLQQSIYQHVFSIKVENSVDPDQMATVFLKNVCYKSRFRRARVSLILSFMNIHAKLHPL